jgi:hypothetical protein
MWWAPNVHEPGGRGVERAALDEFVHPDLNGAVSTDRIDAERIWHQASCDAARAWARFGQPCEIRSHLWPFMQASAIVVELDVVSQQGECRRCIAPDEGGVRAGRI